MKSNDQRSTCIDNLRQFASRLAYLLSVASLSHSRWRTISTIKQQSTNEIIYPKIKDRKTIAAIGEERVDGSYLCPATVMSRCNAKRCIYTGGIGQYRQASAVFHWKTPGAGSEIANSLTIEGNFRVPATRRATNNMADASISYRNLPIKYRTFPMLYRLYIYGPIRFCTTRRLPGYIT